MSGRGRRDNGLPATLWTPLRDVDPRVGEHLLDVLREAGVAAYLEPSADVEPYTRAVSLPSPPTDRLFVDRSRTSEARALVEQHVDDAAPERTRAPRAPRREVDEDAEWARIVAAFEAEHGRTGVDLGSGDTDASAAPPPAPVEPSVLDRPDEHYEPPPPPPVPAPAPASLYAVLLIAAGAVLVGAPRVLGLSADLGLVLGVAAVVGGVGVLVSRMRERSTDDGDDGAVV
ncbi:hypothetical protein DQ238_15500 [Geodermatophilus sp. TF02-6]|uniref:hypothetical protein n=1 Tax=Geodermatophilus sp. TF02-6 TaxID=2250575 RepID=UPI000DE9C355|nr:hypothetical protein [Geodermatophilus sp. TF02-6]RBY77104.1 hypothetical protein DQ238_15500 [Geodermatophilus sp. TF02-6]